MRLVVDTNILFSFFRENPVRYVIVNAPLLGLELCAPAYAFDELEKDTVKSDLIKYTKTKHHEDLYEAAASLRELVNIIPAISFKAREAEAEQCSPDKKDTPFFALALHLNAKIWSNEPRLKRQSKIEVLNSREVFALLKLQ